MRFKSLLRNLGLTSAWALEAGVAVILLLAGVALMPVLIFYAGVTALGRYDGASLARLYDALFDGIHSGSSASWIVFLGPYALYLLFRAMRFLLACRNAGLTPRFKFCATRTL